MLHYRVSSGCFSGVGCGCSSRALIIFLIKEYARRDEQDQYNKPNPGIGTALWLYI